MRQTAVKLTEGKGSKVQISTIRLRQTLKVAKCEAVFLGCQVRIKTIFAAQNLTADLI